MGRTETVYGVWYLNMDQDLLRLRLIREDAKNDAHTLDGMPFTGKTVGTMFGNIFASLDALARTMEYMIQREKDRVSNQGK